MFENIKKWFEDNREFGLTLWYAYDPISKKPSITLLMAYLSFMVALIAGIISVFYPSTLLGTFALMTFAIVYTILYMIRSLNKAKFDLDDKSFELETNEEKEKK